ncbi:arylsulfatase [Sandarakinorhabdus sp. DWP1-3-1]|uniref:arylsulfatase n=1 Tax=Sandarakinorhabdus sp. DWP1-3-1 TaxID=2804627 RepID=UPI003CF6984D
MPAPIAPARPNIILIVADDWGFTDVGAYGGEIATPNLDALAASGTRFANFHVAGSCAPTRAMLQTGVGSHRAGLGNMPETIPPEHRGKPGYGAELNDRVVTIADRLRATGYRTYLTGKWHLGNRARNLPTGMGYDRAFALGQSGADNFEEKPNLLLYDKAAWTEDGKPAHLPKDYYSSRFIVDRMIRYVDAGNASGKPFLASINFLANHIPVQAPDGDIAAYKDRYAAGWTSLRAERRAGAIAKGVMPPGTAMVAMDTTGDWQALTPAERAARARAMAAYGGMATSMDREIGRLVAHLKAIGAYDNTVFVFLSDNGGEATDPMAKPFNAAMARLYYNQNPDQQGRPGSLTAIGASFASAVSSPLRGYKFTASEGGLRVPLIISWPGNPALVRNGVANGFAHVTDVAPTLLALAGVAAPAGRFGGRTVEPMQGRDLTPLLTGAATRVHPADEALGYELSGNAVLFRGDLKLVRNLAPYGDGAWHLYDIVRDPGETHDLAAARPDVFRSMQANYADFAARDQVLPMPAGYQAPRQIEANALDELLVPRLLRLMPWVVGVLGLFVGGAVAWRRREKTRQASQSGG